jgi:hypothetical protein
LQHKLHATVLRQTAGKTGARIFLSATAGFSLAGKRKMAAREVAAAGNLAEKKTRGCRLRA